MDGQMKTFQRRKLNEPTAARHDGTKTTKSTKKGHGIMVYIPVRRRTSKRLRHECIDAGIEVHRIWGRDSKRSIYERAFCLELHSRGVEFESEKRIRCRLSRRG